MHSQLESGRNPARKPDFRPGSTIVQHRVEGHPVDRLGRVRRVLLDEPGTVRQRGELEKPNGGGLRPSTTWEDLRNRGKEAGAKQQVGEAMNL